MLRQVCYFLCFLVTEHICTFAFGYHVKEEPIVLYVFTIKEKKIWIRYTHILFLLLCLCVYGTLCVSADTITTANKWRSKDKF